MRHTRVVVPQYGGPEVISAIEEDIPTPNSGVGIWSERSIDSVRA
jgi:hypothetical protein